MIQNIVQPDDWHVHLRDGAMLEAVAPHSKIFGRVLAMPNTSPPITSVTAALEHLERIRATGVQALGTCYLTDRTDPDELERGFKEGAWLAGKLYPAGATTNSAHGVTNLYNLTNVFGRMSKIGMTLCMHGEVTDPSVDIFDREAMFLERVLGPLLGKFPDLRCVLEHVTTVEGVEFVLRHKNVAATITPHHLWWNRNALFAGGLRPHAYCLPILKREEDRRALVQAATSGDPRFFAGTDSAPHLIGNKEKDCGCAGVFNAPTAIATYAEVFFNELGHFDTLKGFLSRNGAEFYRLPQNQGPYIMLKREPWTPPQSIALADGSQVRVFRGGETLPWSVVSSQP